MSLLLDVFPRLPWVVVNPEESKAATLLLLFPAGRSTREAGAGPGMREVMAGTTSSCGGHIQPPREATAGGSSRPCLRFRPSPSVARHWVLAAPGFVLEMQEPAAEDGDGIQQPTGGSGSVWQQVVLCCISRGVTVGRGCGQCRGSLGAEIGLAKCCCLPRYKAPWEPEGNPSLGKPSLCCPGGFEPLGREKTQFALYH